MASRYQIQMDFSQAERKAAELDGIAGDLSRLSGTDLQNTLNSLGNNWKGENAGLYIGKGFQLMENMEKTAASLRQTAEAIRSVARNIYNAEMEALRIAEEREAAASRTAESEASVRSMAEEISRTTEDMLRTAFSAIKSSNGSSAASSPEGTGGGFSTGGGNGGGGGAW
ncbi:MAG: hypothetical protein HDR14_08730 [Lachnospiraceae bacterium]|nr:hypothetical protein [Lachnospiraceae bacterium]